MHSPCVPPFAVLCSSSGIANSDHVSAFSAYFPDHASALIPPHARLCPHQAPKIYVINPFPNSFKPFPIISETIALCSAIRSLPWYVSDRANTQQCMRNISLLALSFKSCRIFTILGTSPTLARDHHCQGCQGCFGGLFFPWFLHTFYCSLALGLCREGRV